VSKLDFRRYTFADRQQSWRSHWSASVESVEIERSTDGLRCRITTGADTGRGQYGGVKLPLPPPEALRVTMSVEHPENVIALHLHGTNGKRKQLAQWRYVFTDLEPPHDAPTTYTLIPGVDSGPFAAAAATDLHELAALHVFARVRPNSTAGITVHALEVAPAPLLQPDVSHLRFVPLAMDDDLDAYTSHWSQTSQNVTLSREAEGVRCRIVAGSDEGHGRYGGIRIRLQPFDALRFEASLSQPENVMALLVDGYDAKRRRVARWTNRPDDWYPLPTDKSVFTLAPGQISGRFVPEGDTRIQRITELHFFARGAPPRRVGASRNVRLEFGGPRVRAGHARRTS
jgi:hypothetical protein